MKKEGGEWKRISWEEAINEIGDGMMSIRVKNPGQIQCLLAGFSEA